MTRDDAWRALADALQALGALGEPLAVLPLKVYLAAHKAGHVPEAVVVHRRLERNVHDGGLQLDQAGDQEAGGAPVGAESASG